MSQDSFNETRAELFEALGHPMRISILAALESRPMGFAEIKKSVGIESSGHLQFHLRKLGGLVQDARNGDYALTDGGRDALRVFRTTTVKTSDHTFIPSRVYRKYLSAIAILGLLAIVLTGAIIVEVSSSTAQSSSLNNQLSSQRDQLNSQKEQINSLQSQTNSLLSQLSQYNQVILKGDIWLESNSCPPSSNCTYTASGAYANLGGRTANSANVTVTFYSAPGPAVCTRTYSLGSVAPQSLNHSGVFICLGATSTPAGSITWGFAWS